MNLRTRIALLLVVAGMAGGCAATAAIECAMAATTAMQESCRASTGG